MYPLALSLKVLQLPECIREPPESKPQGNKQLWMPMATWNSRQSTTRSLRQNLAKWVAQSEAEQAVSA